MYHNIPLLFFQVYFYICCSVLYFTASHVLISWGYALHEKDQEKLGIAIQSVELAQQSLLELYKSENMLLAEHAFDLLESMGKINQKLRRLASITKE